MCDSSTRPAFIPAADTARVEMRYSQYGQQCENVLYWHGAGMDETALETLVGLVVEAWGDHFKPLQPSTLRLQEVIGTRQNVAEDIQFTQLIETDGTASGVGLPGNVTLAISFKSGFSGRSRRGRMYWLQLTEDDTTGNLVNDGFLLTLAEAVTAFFTDVADGAGVDHSIVSYCHDGVWRTDALVTPVTAYAFADDFIDSQRRRLTGRGS